MKKFTKGVLIAAGCFLAMGVILGSIGAIGRVYAGEKIANGEDLVMIRDTWRKFGNWNFRWRRGNASGITVEYDGVEFDKNYNTSYGSFTDDSLDATNICNLNLEIGGGSVVLCTGNQMELKKDGEVECQYYIEGDTFYLKQKCPVGAGRADIRLTIPEGMKLDEVEITMGAGEIVTNGLLAAEKVGIEVDAGEITMEEVQAEKFSADVGAGSVAVEKLDAHDCDVDVDMGSVVVQDGLVTGDLDADVSMGEIQILLRDSYEAHDYEVNCSMGELNIAEGGRNVRKYGGLANSMEYFGKDSAGDSKYDLNCSMGSIYVRFEG